MCQVERCELRIPSVLAALEELSATCISDLLHETNSHQLLEVLQMAEKFLHHVGVLFAIIDDVFVFVFYFYFF